MREKSIGIIGFGNMGSAIADRIKNKYRVFIFDRDKEKTKDLKAITVAASIADLIGQSDVVILAVKPQDFKSVLGEIKGATKYRLLISIAAGITTSYIETKVDKARVVRAMPNLPAKVGEGMVCLYKGKRATDGDLHSSEELFQKLGETLILDNEAMINNATAVSGSGPGFFYDMSNGKTIEEMKKFVPSFATALTDSAVNIGFSKPVAKILAVTTANGSIAYLEQMHLSPEEAKKQVASKGGTTEAGLEVLHKGGSLTEAVQAALKRAEELSK